MRTYDTIDGNFISVTSVFPPKDMKDWAAKTQFERDMDKAWEAYSGGTQFEDKKHFLEYMKPEKWEHKVKTIESFYWGSWHHNAIEFWCKEGYSGDYTDFLNFLSDYYPVDKVNILGSWFRAIKENNIKILRSEMTVWHPVYRYAGTLDAICIFDDCVCVADWKTGKGDYTHFIQCEAYRRAYMYNTGEEPAGRLVLRSDKDEPGRYELKMRPLQVDTEIRVWEDKRKKAGNQATRDINHFPADHNVDFDVFLSYLKAYERSRMK